MTDVDRSNAVAAEPNADTGDAHRSFRGHPGAARWAALWVLPYLLLGIVWVFSNPPGAAPDESDHLIKAIAAGQLHIGEPYGGPVGTKPGTIRNSSISRTVQIPADIAPGAQFNCTAFHPDLSASCQYLPPPGKTAQIRTAQIKVTTAVGAYPVFGYLPIGVAALLAGTPEQAFYLARLAALAQSIALLFLGVWHLARWLDRGAAVGLALAVTPMAVFASASVSTSGIEIMAAAAVACVVVVSTRCPSTLADPGTLAIVAVAGSALVLARQLGAIALLLLAVTALLRGGARVVWDELRHRRWPMIATVAAVGMSGVAVVAWELRYDHPALTGPVYSPDAFGRFVGSTLSYVLMGVGRFGWLDTSLPGPAYAMWIIAAVIVIGGALLVGRRADRWTIIGASVAILVVTYVTYATVFFPIGASVQGRHLLPMFMIVPLLAGVVLAEQLQESTTAPLSRRLAVMVGVTMSFLQLLSPLVNARRYAVGTNGPIWFLTTAEWSPPGGSWPWIVMATVAAVWLGAMTVVAGRRPVALPALHTSTIALASDAPPASSEPENVER